MKIIKQGKHPLDVLDEPIRLECTHCKTVVEAKETDLRPNTIKLSYYESETNSYICDCPVCKQVIYDRDLIRMQLRRHPDYIPRFILFADRS